MAKHSASILEWARQGAEARWQQLQTEMASLVATFPHLSTLSKSARAGRGTGSPAAGGRGRATGRKAAQATAGDTPRRRRSQMTAAQKKAVSLRMKKYWAERRKAAGKA
jgi:hypothetical protein